MKATKQTIAKFKEAARLVESQEKGFCGSEFLVYMINNSNRAEKLKSLKKALFMLGQMRNAVNKTAKSLRLDCSFDVISREKIADIMAAFGPANDGSKLVNELATEMLKSGSKSQEQDRRLGAALKGFRKYNLMLSSQVSKLSKLLEEPERSLSDLNAEDKLDVLSALALGKSDSEVSNSHAVSPSAINKLKNRYHPKKEGKV